MTTPGGAAARPVRIALHRALAPWAPEVSYVFRTLARTAGYPYELLWADALTPGERVDVCYGPAGAEMPGEPLVRIAASGHSFADAATMEPARVAERDGLPVLEFAGESLSKALINQGHTGPTGDPIFACYWLLSGAREPSYRRDNRDNLHLDGSAFLAARLQARPLVSLYAAWLRRRFAEAGLAPLPAPWLPAGGAAPTAAPGAAFAFTHDVDYPQIIRPIEAARLVAARGARGLRSAAAVLSGESHYWTFKEWVDFERALGAHGAFYFMARRGSLLQYALGTPDDFYDVEAPEFRELFAYLRDEGAEVGLHASYHAHRGADVLRAERERLERAAGVHVEGNRHHYWHLDPTDPNETLRRHEAAGLRYDSSLGLELYPGFRRGICHPFRVFHAGERRELRVVQLPPAWMDDHFDRRLAKNGIADPDAAALELVGAAERTGGIVVVDYHSRGMNADVYPRYGPWLARFVSTHLTARVAYHTPAELARQYEAYERALESRSVDRATPGREALYVGAGAGAGA